MADALRHLTRLGVYKVAMPVSRKFLDFFYSNKQVIINSLHPTISVAGVVPEKPSVSRVLDYILSYK
jgi:hypothetical protein